MSVAVTVVTARKLPDSAESSSTFSVTVPAGTTKLIVVMGRTTGDLVSSLTFDGIALTGPEVSAPSAPGINALTVRAWYLDNPTATTANVVATYNAATRGIIVAIGLSGAKSGAFSATNNAQSNAALSVNSTTNGIVLSAFAVAVTGTPRTITLSAGTQHYNDSNVSGVCLGVSSQAGTGSSVSTQWTPSAGTGQHIVFNVESVGPVITSQPSAVTRILTNANTASFSVTATGTGSLSYDWELETAVGSDTYANLANGDGATWTGQAAATATGTFTAKTISGRKIRCNVTDSTGTNTTLPVAITLFDGPQVTAFPATDVNGESTATLTCDYVTGVGEAVEVAILLPDGRLAVTTTTTAP
jgi:hypothetical protein